MSLWLTLFDFDRTLVRENSIGLLFAGACGCGPSWWPLWQELPAVMGSSLAYRGGLRAAIKERLYRSCLTGRSEGEIRAIGERIAGRLTPNPSVVRALEEVAAAGGDNWVVTAAPQAFVQGVVTAKGWPVARVIGTEPPTAADGRYTGELRGECIREEKARRIREAALGLRNRDQPPILAAYGNLPADLPMLALARRGYVVRRGRIAIHH